MNLDFASDNAGPVHPKVLDAIVRANDGPARAYGEDSWTLRACEALREVLEAPEAAVHLVTTGTAANALCLALLARPWDAVFCTDVAHVHEDECNAPEMFTGGAKLFPLPAPEAKLDPAALERALGALGSVHGPQKGPVTIAQATERGNVYRPQEVEAIARVAQAAGVRLHMDGTRLANALVQLGCAPAATTWRAGVTALSFGGTKNGLMGAEAVVLFDPALSREAELRRKRAGHLVSKHRFLAAQMLAYLEGGLWLELAAQANAAAARLLQGLGSLGWPPLWPVESNLAFVAMPRRVHRRLFAAGASYHLWGPETGDPDEPVLCRLVCDWSKTDAEVDRFLEVAAGAC